MKFYSIFFITAITNAEVIFVNVVHRHGDRTPANIYPTDPYQESFWKEGLGILTNLGKNQLYGLGAFMRSRYSGFLPLEYQDADVHVESSEMSRTLMSAYCSLASLYEPHGDDLWSTYVEHWQPVPVYVLPESQDNTILNSRPCPRHYQLSQITYETNISEERKTKFREILKNVSQYMGYNLNPEKFDDRNSIAGVAFDALSSEHSKNLKLPNWTTDFFPEPILKMYQFFFYELPNFNNELKRLRCGSLLKEIIQHFDDKINGNITQKWWQYSGHDITIASLLICLNVYDGEVPAYASAVFLELHKRSENNYDVSVVYRKSQDVVQNLIIPMCTLHCPFEKFKELYSDVVPDDWQEECAKK